MAKSLTDDLDKVLATICRFFADEGKAREVAILAEAKASIEQSNYDNWNGGVYGYTINLVLPEFLYQQLGAVKDIEQLEKAFLDRATDISRLYENEYIEHFKILTELHDDLNWREKAKAYVSGQGLTNQGRARSDNLAPKMSDGLLFRSQPEINLYRAFKSLGVTFAPLPVFVRGGETYRRIEPDFIVLKEGIVLHVEVDGDTVHRETPLEAHNRTTMMAHEGVHVERVNASDCGTEEKARVCAQRLLGIIAKLRASR
jgi:hypothetical protein